MRLSLIVQRHGLPSVQILWRTDCFLSRQASSGTDSTISQFLDQVNDVVPLEAEHWGLEDYVVEVKGFECLHFADLCQILKEDEEVTYVSHLRCLIQPA